MHTSIEIEKILK